jgi:hypothetical protein
MSDGASTQSLAARRTEAFPDGRTSCPKSFGFASRHESLLPIQNVMLRPDNMERSAIPWHLLVSRVRDLIGILTRSLARLGGASFFGCYWSKRKPDEVRPSSLHSFTSAARLLLLTSRDDIGRGADVVYST